MGKGVQIGRIENEPLRDYHAVDAIGSSKFRVFMRSPREYWFRYVSGLMSDDKDTDALRFGRVAHAVILEKEDYTVVPETIDRRTKKGREEYELLAERTDNLLSAEEGVTLERMIEYGLSGNHAARKLIDGCKEHETSYRAKYKGHYLQCRPDGMSDEYIIDLKTCRTIDGLLSDFFRKGYHIQAAWYNFVLMLCGEQPKDFEFIGLSKDWGYECTVLEYKYEESQAVWDNICQPALDSMIKSIESNVFMPSHDAVMSITNNNRMFL